MKIHDFFVVCVKVNVQVIQCFWQHLYSLAKFLEIIFNIFTKHYSIRRRNRKWLTAQAVFLFMVSLPFYGWSFLLWTFHIGYIVRDDTCNRFFAGFFLRVATFKLLQSLRLLETFLLDHFSTGVTEPYQILIHCETKPYLNRLPNFTLS